MFSTQCHLSAFYALVAIPQVSQHDFRIMEQYSAIFVQITIFAHAIRTAAASEWVDRARCGDDVIPGISHNSVVCFDFMRVHHHGQ